jgi:hypothetical protein
MRAIPELDVVARLGGQTDRLGPFSQQRVNETTNFRGEDNA